MEKIKRLQKIAITGGKGGTGKSTFSILLAEKLARQGKKIILCDCDTECPNDYLLLNTKLKKIVKRVYTEFPKLIKSKCKKCGLCVKSCHNNAIFQIPNQYPIFLKDLCVGCGTCQLVCPYGAIKSTKEEIGKIHLNKIQGSGIRYKNFYLVTGLANAELEETASIVAQAKDFALAFAEKIDADYIFFDTAAGMHCPVVKALLDVDFAYAVTEPTPMGAYDLDLILTLCKKLKIPAKIILNKANLGSKKVFTKILKKYKINIEKEISYSNKLAQKYSNGKLLNFDLTLIPEI